MKANRIWAAAAVLVVTLVIGGGSAGAVDSKALLLEMATKIAQAQRFTVTMMMNYDAVQKTGEKVEFSEKRKITIERPGHLRVDARQSDGDRSLMIFDGKTIALCSLTHNVYSQTKFTGSVDEAVRFAGGRLGIRIPLARMLVTSFPREIESLMREVYYVERDTLRESPTDHLFIVFDNVDCQVWIAADKLPRRIVLTYKHDPGQPQFRADFSGWDLEPKIPSQAFVFTPPSGAEKIPMLLPAAVLPALDKEKQKQKGGAQ
ncbi:MAG: DUF2092 domain-containing protein [Deltaproteobacteria bacterium]|nr:DUF2092 domain-containing protein [Deltaproteobacteria bacterium]